MSSPAELFSRKEIAAFFKRDRITVFRWERQGLRFRGGRITVAEVAWFLEQRDAARKLGIPTREFLSRPRAERERLLRVAFALGDSVATTCNIGARDSTQAPA